jgi:hypothetical protein
VLVQATFDLSFVASGVVTELLDVIAARHEAFFVRRKLLELRLTLRRKIALVLLQAFVNRTTPAAYA